MKYSKLIAVAILASTTVACNNDRDETTPPILNSVDRDFMNMATYGNNAEVDAGQMASNKGTDNEIRHFGAMMVTDHTTAQEQLQGVAGRVGVALPQGLDAEHQQAKEQLMSAEGRAFDSLYIHMQVADHKKTITLFENESENGSHQEVVNYANSKLPKLREHLKNAEDISEKY